MYALNKVQLIGNLTRDPEIRQTPSGQAVCNVGLATNRAWTDQNGERKEQTEFHDIVCWGKLAEIVGQYLAKGRKAYFEGRLQTRSWENEAGEKRYKTEIVAENMIMLSGRDGATGAAPMASSEAEASQEAPSEEVKVEDLPF